MRVYKNSNGTYDMYEIEPVIISEEEYNKICKQKELADRKLALENELAMIAKELQNLEPVQIVEPMKVHTSMPMAEPVARKRW